MIFPTVHLQGSFSATAAAEPPFFLVPKSQRHRLRDTLGNQPPQGLETTHATYLASMMAANDADLVRSMCDEVVTISFLRQVKSDRLHLGDSDSLADRLGLLFSAGNLTCSTHTFPQKAKVTAPTRNKNETAWFHLKASPKYSHAKTVKTVSVTTSWMTFN